MGANLGGFIPPIFSCPTSASRDDLFFFGSDDPFFYLHFIALHCDGQKFGQPRGGVKFAKSSPPNLKKWSILRNHSPNAQHKFAPLAVATMNKIPTESFMLSLRATGVESRRGQQTIKG